MVFLTGVLGRIQARYKDSRAYRSLLLEAGHVSQTFCLTATWLGLAPFCTQAIADSAVEARLGLDPKAETVLYAMGAGVPSPDGIYRSWPLRHGRGNPHARPSRASSAR